MKYYLESNRGNFDNTYRNGLDTLIWVPLNSRTASGKQSDASFRTSPDPESVSLTEWISRRLTKGDIVAPVNPAAHYGTFDDDAAAASGSVPVGGVYVKSGTNKLHTRMS
jgi:hypothetical protein